MPGTSTTGAHRLLMWATAVVAGVIAVVFLSLPSHASALPRAAVGAGTARAVAVPGLAVLADTETSGNGETVGNGETAGTRPQLALVPAAGAAVAPAVTPGFADSAAGGAVAGQPAGATELSVDSVSAPPAAVPWIVVVLFVLVVAGAVRAYGRSPQRAAIRSRRTPH